MSVYRAKCKKLKGTDYREVRKKAFRIYTEIKKRSKRKPYVRSAYFRKEKIFLDLFWTHTFEKRNFADQIRRLRFYPCAIELIENSKFQPTVKNNPNKSSEVLYRFKGMEGSEEFTVQIKGNRNNNKKWLLSIFPS